MLTDFLCKYNANKSRLPQAIKEPTLWKYLMFLFHIAANIESSGGSQIYILYYINTSNIGKLKTFSNFWKHLKRNIKTIRIILFIVCDELPTGSFRTLNKLICWPVLLLWQDPINHVDSSSLSGHVMSWGICDEIHSLPCQFRHFPVS